VRWSISWAVVGDRDGEHVTATAGARRWLTASHCGNSGMPAFRVSALACASRATTWN
jgi:hypothetical protein